MEDVQVSIDRIVVEFTDIYWSIRINKVLSIDSPNLKVMKSCE